MPKIIFGKSHLSREREDFMVDYDRNWREDDLRDWDEADDRANWPEDMDDEFEDNG